ncbi:MAG: hypothetical protein U0263_18275 [Polyangiaceae bacterium]
MRSLSACHRATSGTRSRRSAAQLEPRLPKLTVSLAPGAPAGTRVLRDGIELGAAALDTALPVDPGKHSIVVQAPGRAPSETSVESSEGRPSASSCVGAAKRRGKPSGTRSNGKKTWGWVLTGVGAAGVGVGAVTGFMVLGEKRRVDDNCDAQKRCNQTGMDAVDRGRTLGTVSGVSFIVGGLSLAGGAHLLLSSSSKESPPTALQIRPGWVGAVRHF